MSRIILKLWIFMLMFLQNANLYGVEENMPAKASKILFADKLDDNKQKGWITAPDNYLLHPEFGQVYFIKPQTPPLTGMPQVGDSSWSRYRVELEFLPAGQGMGFIGLDFHVQENGACCNMHFSDTDTNHTEIFQSAGRWNSGNTSWKLQPLSQRRPEFKKGEWIKIRLDVGETVANVYVNNDSVPVYTIYDLPFADGGIRLFSYAGSAFVRNLVITELDNDVTPLLEDAWAHYSNGSVLRNWQISPLLPPDFASEQDLPELAEDEVQWRGVKADRRGIVNISELFPDNNDRAVVYARTVIYSSDNITRRCLFSYTDQLTIWCNGQLVVNNVPRGWNDPGREEADGWGRIMPDQFEAFMELLPGENVLLLRLQVNEPYFGSGFWLRLQ